MLKTSEVEIWRLSILVYKLVKQALITQFMDNRSYERFKSIDIRTTIAEGQDTLASFGRISSPTKLCFALQV